MSKKQLYLTSGVIALLFILTMAMIFEIREVPDYDWQTQYDLDQKDPMDAFAFTELLKDRFGDELVNIKSDTSALDSTINGQLYVSIGPKIRYSNQEEKDLINFIKAGNNALIISAKINLTIPVIKLDKDNNQWDHENNQQEYDKHEDQNEYNESNEIVYVDEDEEESDLIEDEFYEVESDDLLHEDASKVDSTQNEFVHDSILSSTNLVWQLSSFKDTILLFDFAPFDSTTNADFAFKYYGREFKKAQSYEFSYLTFDAIKRETLIFAKDSLDIYSKIKIGDGNLYIHTVPELFTNLATQQSFYLDHFNKVFSYFDTKQVILDKPDPLSYLLDRDNQKSPLEYILSVPSLSWAYYLLVATLLLFVIFRGKRTQRIIPTIEKNSNTSMDYIKTLSSLHEEQGQNSKLVKHIRDGFYHRIKSKYFLNHKDELFIEKLAAKSKIDLLEIENLIHKLTSTGGTEFSDDQLITLHKQIESFYKKSA